MSSQENLSAKLLINGGYGVQASNPRMRKRGGIIGIHCSLMSEGRPLRPEQDELNAERKRRKDEIWEASDGTLFHFFSRRWPHRHWHYFESEFWRKRGGDPVPPFEWMIDHLDHMVNLGGIDHVGFGCDFVIDMSPPRLRRAPQIPQRHA